MRVNYTPSPCREKVGMRVNYLKKRPLAPLTLTLSPRRGELYSFSLSGEGWDEGELFVKVPTGTPHPDPLP